MTLRLQPWRGYEWVVGAIRTVGRVMETVGRTPVCCGPRAHNSIGQIEKVFWNVAPLIAVPYV